MTMILKYEITQYFMKMSVNKMCYLLSHQYSINLTKKIPLKLCAVF